MDGQSNTNFVLVFLLMLNVIVQVCIGYWSWVNFKLAMENLEITREIWRLARLALRGKRNLPPIYGIVARNLHRSLRLQRLYVKVHGN